MLRQLRPVFALLLLAAPSGLAGQAAAPDPRSPLLERLHLSAQTLIGATSGLSPAQWSYKAAPERWSIAEVTEHLVLTEELLAGMIAQSLAGPARTTLPANPEEIDQKVVTGLGDRTQRFQAPPVAQPSGSRGNGPALIAAFGEARRKVADLIRSTPEDLRAHAAPHPVFGELDVHQWVLLLSAHVERHVAQIEEVKAASGYPR